MDSRYVYRSLEDDIGRSVWEDRHPHSFLLRLLRFKIRELGDRSSLLALRAACLSSVAAHPSVDPDDTYETVKEILTGFREARFPYFGREKSVQTNHETDAEKYERYFKILREMNRKDAEKKGKKPDGTQYRKDGIMSKQGVSVG